MDSMEKSKRFPSELLQDKKMNAYMCTVWAAAGMTVRENKEILLALFNTNPI